MRVLYVDLEHEWRGGQASLCLPCAGFANGDTMLNCWQRKTRRDAKPEHRKHRNGSICGDRFP